jgi:uncharacterized protein YjdB
MRNYGDVLAVIGNKEFKRIIVALLLLTILLPLIGCSGGGGGGASSPAVTLQTIAVTPESSSLPKGLSQQFVATGIYSDGTSRDITAAVTWSSDATPIATVNGAGLASGVDVGIATITATLNAVFGSTTQTVTAAILQSIAVTPASPIIPIGLSRQFVATGTYSDGTSRDITADVTWSSDATSVATVDSAGLASGVDVGFATISATLNAVSGSATQTVIAAVLQTIAVTPANPSIPNGLTQQFAATGTYSDGASRDITADAIWSSDATSVATVNSTGLASGVDVGDATITATLDAISGSATQTVTAAVLQAIAVTPATTSIPKGLTRQFAATGTYSDGTSRDITATVTWTSETTTVATVNSVGLASGVDVGTAIITATLDAVFNSAVQTVTAAVLQTIAVTPASPSIPKGLTQQFVATGTYSDGTTQNLNATVTWSSNVTTVATVNSTGLASGVDVGGATITATLDAISGSATQTVTDAILQAIAVTPMSSSIPKGLTQQFVATGTYSDGSTQDLSATVNWSSDTTPVVTVSNAGLARGINIGTATITATLVAFTDSATQNVTAAVLQTIDVTPVASVSPTVPKGLTLQLLATGNYSDATTQDLTALVNWTSNSTPIATVNGVGIASGVDLGTVWISATLGVLSGGMPLTVTPAIMTTISVGGYNPYSPSCFPNTVSPSYTEICFGSPTILTGQTLQFNAYGGYSDGSTQDVTSIATWTSGDPLVATIGTTGFAEALSSGGSNITASIGEFSSSVLLGVKTQVYYSYYVCTYFSFGSCREGYYDNYYNYY